MVYGRRDHSGGDRRTGRLCKRSAEGGGVWQRPFFWLYPCEFLGNLCYDNVLSCVVYIRKKQGGNKPKGVLCTFMGSRVGARRFYDVCAEMSHRRAAAVFISSVIGFLRETYR